jgi:nucleotide-binding universal stress UspA family protein
MHKLLVPVDGSDNAMRALEYTIGLAKEHGPIELVIVYAHEPPIVYGELAIDLPEETLKELQRKHGEDILRPYIETAKRAGVTFTSQVLIGDTIPKSIASCAETLGCDGIVMGTRGMSAIGNLVAGSVATKVIHLTKLPVTLVK